MDVRVYVPDASRDYISGLTIKDVDSVVFNAPGKIIPVADIRSGLLFDLYVEDSETTVKRMYGKDTLVVAFVDF